MNRTEGDSWKSVSLNSTDLKVGRPGSSMRWTRDEKIPLLSVCFSELGGLYFVLFQGIHWKSSVASGLFNCRSSTYTLDSSVYISKPPVEGRAHGGDCQRLTVAWDEAMPFGPCRKGLIPSVWSHREEVELVTGGPSERP